MKKIISILSICAVFLTLPLLGGEEIKPEIRDLDTVCLAAMTGNGPFDQMAQKIPAFIGEFFKQNLKPKSPVMGIYYHDPETVKDPAGYKWDVAFEIEKGAEVKAPLKKLEYKAGKAVVYLHVGPYEKTGESYNLIFKFAEEKGYKVVWPVFSRYINTPMEAKPEDLKTEIIVPIEKK